MQIYAVQDERKVFLQLAVDSSGKYKAHPDLPGGKAILTQIHACRNVFQVAVAPKDAGVPHRFQAACPLPTGKGL